MATTLKKVSSLPELTSVTADDLFYVVNDPTGTPSSNKITVAHAFESNVAANVAFNGPLTVSGSLSGNTVQSRYIATPANSSAVPAGFSIGSIWSDGNYVYIVTGASAIKRASIETW